jgi:hypothetical protein
MTPNTGFFHGAHNCLRVLDIQCQRFVQEEVFPRLSTSNTDTSTPFIFHAQADNMDIITR